MRRGGGDGGIACRDAGFGWGRGKVLKNALVFVKSAKGGRQEVRVLFDLRAKDAKKSKGARFFAM
jgi:hypothetical protein